MLTFLAVPLLIFIVALAAGFVIFAIQKRANKPDRLAPALQQNPPVSPKAPGA